MEKLILLVDAYEIHSNKTDKDYYIIEYVDLENNRCKSMLKSVEDFEKNKFDKIKSKVKKESVNEVVGIFKINQYDKAELVDIK